MGDTNELAVKLAVLEANFSHVIDDIAEIKLLLRAINDDLDGINSLKLKLLGGASVIAATWALISDKVLKLASLWNN